MAEPAAYPCPAWGQRDRALFLAMAAFAFLVRLVYLISYSRTPYWDALVMDPRSHWELARQLAAGRGMGPYAYFRAPLYIWILSGFIALFGESLWPIRIFQALVGSLAAGMTFRLARWYLHRAPAVVAAGLLAVYWIPVYYDGELLTENPAALLNLLALIAVVRADQPPAQPGRLKLLSWLLAGALTGLAALARPNIMLFAGVVPLILLVRFFLTRGKNHQQEGGGPAPARLLLAALAPAVIYSAGVVLAVAPVTARNWIVAHDLVAIASQGGINFWIGNHEGADGKTVVVPYPRREIPLSYLESRADHPWLGEDVWLSSAYGAEEALKSRVRESEISNYWYHEAFRWMREHPGQAAALLAKKALYLFQRTEVSNNRDLIAHARAVPALRVLSAPLNFGMISPLILAGAVLALRRREWLWPLAFFIAYSLTVIAFFVTTRYREPLLPEGLCLAGLCLQELASRAGKGGSKNSAARLRAAAPLIALIVIFAAIVNMPWPRWNDRPLRSAMHYNLGIAFAEKGKWKDAEAELKTALAIKSPYPEAHFWLGKVMADAGRPADAVKEFEACLEEAPAYAIAHYELSAIYFQKSREKGDADYQQGLAHLQEAHRLAPDQFPAPSP